MERKWWEDSNSSNFELTPLWLREVASEYGLNPGIARVSGGLDPDAVRVLDERAQQLERGAIDVSTNWNPTQASISSGIELLDYGPLAFGEVTEGDSLLGQQAGVNQTVELFDSAGRVGYPCCDQPFAASATSQQSAKLAFENGFERGFSQGFEKGFDKASSQQPKSIIFRNVQFAGGYAEFVAGNVVGGTINNLSPLLSEQWKSIEKDLVKILDSFPSSGNFNDPKANAIKALEVLEEVSKNPSLYQEIVDFKRSLHANGLFHQSMNPVINSLMAFFPM